MYQISLEGGIEVGWITQNLEEATDSFLGFILCLPLDVYWEMGLVEVTQNAIK